MSRVDTPADLAGSAYETALHDKANHLEQTLIHQTIDDIQSWRLAVDVQWRAQHPDRPHPIGPTSPDDIQQYTDAVRTNYYDWVVPAFERWRQPDPDALDPVIEALRGIEGSFGGSQDDAGRFYPHNGELSRIHLIEDEMEHWQGRFQENFLTDFANPLLSVTQNQAFAAAMVRSQLECCKIIYIRVRNGILKLLDQSLGAVKQLDNAKDPKSFLWGSIVICIIGTGLALVPELAVPGAALNIVGTLGQGLIPEPTQTNDLSAPTAQEVAVNIAGALGKMTSDLLAEEQRVATALRNIAETIAGSRARSLSANTSGPLAVATPELATASITDLVHGALRPDG